MEDGFCDLRSFRLSTADIPGASETDFTGHHSALSDKYRFSPQFGQKANAVAARRRSPQQSVNIGEMPSKKKSLVTSATGGEK